MRNELRVLLLAGALLALAPRVTLACEEKLDATAAATAVSCTVMTTCESSSAATCKTITITRTSTCSGSAVATMNAPACPTTAKAAKKARRHWAPGHLIEPDSMRLVPQDRAPGEQWVIISSRTGTIQVHRTPWAPKKSEARPISQDAPHHS